MLVLNTTLVAIAAALIIILLRVINVMVLVAKVKDVTHMLIHPMDIMEMDIVIIVKNKK